MSNSDSDISEDSEHIFELEDISQPLEPYITDYTLVHKKIRVEELHIGQYVLKILDGAFTINKGDTLLQSFNLDDEPIVLDSVESVSPTTPQDKE